MRNRLWRARLVTIVAVVGSITIVHACGSSHPTGSLGPANLNVTVTATPTNAFPGQSISATVSVSASESVTLDSVQVATSGALTSHQTLSVGTSVPINVTVPFTAPGSVGAGTITIEATAFAGRTTGKGETRIAIADTSHPALQVTISPTGSIVQPGDSVIITIAASDSGALSYTAAKFSGSFTLIDSATAGFAGSVHRTVRAQVPATASLHSPLSITVLAGNVGGVTTSRPLSPFTVSDTTAPLVNGVITTPRGYGFASPGDALSITVNATDNYKLAYVGYQLGAPANVVDSVATSNQSYALHASVPVVSGWVGTPTFTVFARDSLGNRRVLSVGTITVTKHPVVVATLAATVRDATYDAKRGAVYYSMPSLQQVAVLSTTSGLFGTPYAVAGVPHGLDLTPGGDSLVVALVNTANIQIINLNTSTQSSLPVSSGAAGTGPDFLRVSSTDRAIVTITFAGSGYGGSLIEANLLTGATRNLGTVTEYVPLAGSGNRKRILALIDDSCCPEAAEVYDAVADSIIAGAGTVSQYFNYVSADSNGSHYLIDGSEFGSTLSFLTTYSGTQYSGGPSAVAADGATAYFATSVGVVQARLSDGGVVNTFTLNETPAGIWLSRDGYELMIAASSHFFVFDLHP